MNKDKIEQAAKDNARLHFHPEYSKDAFTACVCCFKSGATWQQSQSVEQKTQTVQHLLARKDIEQVFIAGLKYGMYMDTELCNDYPDMDQYLNSICPPLNPQDNEQK